MTRMIPSHKKWLLVFASGVLLVVLSAAPAASQDLVIRFFNVGQGDAALITSREGKSVLIDGGSHAGWPVYLLDSLHIDTLELVVASHNHADHIRGLQSVLETTKVRAYMDNGVPTTTQVYLELYSTLNAHHVKYVPATPQTIRVGSMRLRILPRPPGDTTQNNSSVGILLAYGKFTALFTGDAEDNEREYWETHAGLPHVSVLKVAHHGSPNGTDWPWLEVTRPRVAVISVGAGNSYGHPAQETLRDLEEVGAQIYRTDRDGDITVAVDSLGGFTVRAERSEPVRSWPAGAASRH